MCVCVCVCVVCMYLCVVIYVCECSPKLVRFTCISFAHNITYMCTVCMLALRNFFTSRACVFSLYIYNVYVCMWYCIVVQKREKKLKRDKRIGQVTTHETSSLHDIAVLNQLRTTTFKWQRGRKLGESTLHVVLIVTQ